MTFNISNEDTSIMRLIFNVHQELSRMHLIHILIALQISILVIIFAFICIIATKHEALDAPYTDRFKSTSKSMNRFYYIASHKLAYSISCICLTLLALLVSFSLAFTMYDPYDCVNSIKNGTFALKQEFGKKSNTTDLTTTNNDTLELMVNNEPVTLAKLMRTPEKLHVTPTSKTGQAYIRILKYLRTHHSNIYDVNLVVNLDKTTLTYNDINGKHTVVCYANNTDKNTNNQTVLHY